MKKLVVVISLAVVLGLVLVGCPDPVNPTPPVTEHVAVTGIKDVVTSALVNEAVTLTGTVEPDTATNKAIEWTTATENASITDGKLTATAPGDVVVTATIANGKSATEDYTEDFTITVTNAPVPTRPLTMVMVEGGSYTYQDGESNPEPNTIVADFYLAETEVTQAQWLEVMTEWPGTTVPSEEYGLGDNRPAYYVSWYDAMEFCNALTRDELTEDDVVYTITKEDETDSSTWIVDVDVTKNGYRLPTEREWEYAAGWEENGERNSHAGVNIAVDEKDPNDLDGDENRDEADGIDDNDSTKDLREYAWYEMNNGAEGTPEYGTKDVGTKKPNALGLYDMSGNVNEWCYDVYASRFRVARGGSRESRSSVCRVDFRNAASYATRDRNFGFRVARSVSN